MSQILSFPYLPEGNNPYADQIRCNAFDYAKNTGESGVCLILVTLQDTGKTVQVVANLSAKEASIVLPLFDWEKDYSFGTAFGLSDTVFIISEVSDQAAMQQARETFEKEWNLLFFTLNRENAAIRGSWLDQKSGQWIPVSRSAEGAAAAAAVLHRDMITGTMESTIDQPGGLLEIGLRKERGNVLGLSAGGPVEVRE